MPRVHLSTEARQGREAPSQVIVHGSFFVQEMSVAAIAATAVSAGENFLPFMTATCSMLGPLMTLQDEKMLNVREQQQCVISFASNKLFYLLYMSGVVLVEACFSRSHYGHRAFRLGLKRMRYLMVHVRCG